MPNENLLQKLFLDLFAVLVEPEPITSFYEWCPIKYNNILFDEYFRYKYVPDQWPWQCSKLDKNKAFYERRTEYQNGNTERWISCVRNPKPYRRSKSVLGWISERQSVLWELYSALQGRSIQGRRTKYIY